ncbi:GNAT family N-acetyltransferase [uncultured Psychrobacter sp.]|uniref:GNAT family N-acetyltransferase n=1 Tax=uncultured Psychrobacter sp. TaxID=259303 RepID=UPI0026341AAE|nr:GNAT family N-acetyltransferase [uncultured Psychrobacter sp.]
MNFELEAKTTYLRLVEEKDASFICNLRNDKQLNTYISKSTADDEAQRQWIVNYKKREANGEEYYFIICRKSDNLQIGTVRLYDFKTNRKSFCWGSWILNENKTKYAAVESALLVYEAGFNELGFEQSHYDVMKGNDKVHSFHLKMGAEKVSEDDTNIYYVFPKSQHEKNKIYYAKFLG